MEDSKKKSVMIAIILGCVVLAVGVTIMTRSEKGGLEGIDKDAMLWVKCGNDACGAEYERNQQAFYQEGEDRINPLVKGIPPGICKECGEQSIFKANECIKCGEVFFSGAADGTFPDECPDCGYSPRMAGGKANR